MLTLADICEALDGHRLNDARIWVERGYIFLETNEETIRLSLDRVR